MTFFLLQVYIYDKHFSQFLCYVIMLVADKIIMQQGALSHACIKLSVHPY